MPRNSIPYSLHELRHKIYTSEAASRGIGGRTLLGQTNRALLGSNLAEMQKLAKEVGIPIAEDVYEKSPARMRKATDRELLDAMNVAINERPNPAYAPGARFPAIASRPNISEVLQYFPPDPNVGPWANSKRKISDEQKIAKARELNLVPDRLYENKGIWEDKATPERAGTPPPGPLRAKSVHRSEQYKPEAAGDLFRAHQEREQAARAAAGEQKAAAGAADKVPVANKPQPIQGAPADNKLTIDRFFDTLQSISNSDATEEHKKKRISNVSTNFFRQNPDIKKEQGADAFVRWTRENNLLGKENRPKWNDSFFSSLLNPDTDPIRVKARELNIADGEQKAAAVEPLDRDILHKVLAKRPVPAKLNPPIADPKVAFNNVDEDPAVKEMRDRIIHGEKPSRYVRPRSQTAFGRDRQKSSGIDPFVWNTPVENYPDVPVEPLPKAAFDEKTGIRKGYVNKGIPLGLGDTSEVRNGPVWAQQMGKAISEATLDLANTPYNGWKKRTIADLSPGELRARDMYSFQNPLTAPHIAEQEDEIRDLTYRILENKKASEAAEPYLKNMTKNPAALHEELLGDTEKSQLKSISDEYDTELRDKLLPELKRKYMVPGLERAGHQNKDIEELMRKYSKGRTQALEQAMTKNRLGTLGVAQNYAQMQGVAGKMAGNHVSIDNEREVQATNMLHIANKLQYDTRRQAAEDEERRGLLDRQIMEAKLKEDEARYVEARGHPYKQLAFAAEVNRGLPITNIQTTSLNALRQNPGAGISATKRMVGSLADLSQQAMPHKKGGIIKNRIKRADGGSIMQEAVQNAVIDKEDPLTALRRLMNRQRMMDVSETKIGRRRLNTGGQVNPIQQGANQAREFMGEKDLRAHIESLKTPHEKPMVNRVLDSFFRGAASVGPGNDALGSISTAWNNSAEHRNNELHSQREQTDKAFRDQYELDQLAKKELAGLRKEERENKKFARDELMEKQRFDLENKRFLSDEKYRADKLALKSSEAVKYGKEDTDILIDSNKQIKGAPVLLHELDQLKKINSRIETGTLSRSLGISNDRAQEKLGNGSVKDIQVFEKITRNFALKAAQLFGPRAGAKIVELFEKAKPNLGITQKANDEFIDSLTSEVKYQESLAKHIKTGAKNGIRPSESLDTFEYEFPKTSYDDLDEPKDSNPKPKAPIAPAPQAPALNNDAAKLAKIAELTAERDALK